MRICYSQSLDMLMTTYMAYILISLESIRGNSKFKVSSNVYLRLCVFVCVCVCGGGGAVSPEPR